MGDFYIDNKGIIGVPPGIPGSLPSKHAKHHITGGTDVIPNATDVNSGLMSPTDKQKLDAITQEKIDTWNTVTEKANKVDVYTKSEVNNLLSQAGYGDMMKATYDADNDGVVDLAKDADTVDGKHFTDIQNDAQSKADAALDAAKVYTDQEFAKVANDLASHKNESASLDNLGHVKHAILTATLDTNWSGSAAPYTKTITVSGILATDTPIIDVVMSGTYSTDSARAKAWGYIYRAVTGNGTITFYATEKPTVELPIQIKVVR
jgi:hypothetical protein